MDNDYCCKIAVYTLQNTWVGVGQWVSVVDCEMKYTDGFGQYIVNFKYCGEDLSVPVEVFNTCFEIVNKDIG